jgi:8-oxo-dGTP pyrophosphatase MutT (NUDIX family)
VPGKDKPMSLTDASPPTAPKVIPAATVVIFRNCPAGGPPELLMVQRAKEMRFAGGAAVFPGGRIDPEDRDLAAQLAPDADSLVAAAKIGGIRETLEETGLAIAVTRPVSAGEAADARAMLLERGALAPVVEKFGWQLDLSRLFPFAHWCPPIDGAFDTRFFLADLGTGAVDIAVDSTENTRLFWSSAKESLRMAAEGEIKLIFPTKRNVERLALSNSFESACAHAASFPLDVLSARMVVRDGEDWLIMPDGYGYPVLGEPLWLAKRG